MSPEGVPRWLKRWTAVNTLGLAGLLLVVAVLFQWALADDAQFEDQALRARSQNCLRFENEHLDNVRTLRATYRYLLQLRPGEQEDAINRYVLQRLPETEKRARTDQAPRYCDRPGLGRPEPDPKVPLRPRGLPE